MAQALLPVRMGAKVTIPIRDTTAAILLGSSEKKRLGVKSVQRTKSEVAGIIEQFLNGTGGKWDWDDFCSYRVSDPDLDSVRIRCDGLSSTHPPTEKGRYCSEAGMNILRELVAKLRPAGE